jgi:hypothetical protein
MPNFKHHRPHRINLTRQRAVARLFARHARLSTPAGEHIGCLCQNVAAARTRNDYYLHLAELVDILVQETLDATFGKASA